MLPAHGAPPCQLGDTEPGGSDPAAENAQNLDEASTVCLPGCPARWLPHPWAHWASKDEQRGGLMPAAHKGTHTCTHPHPHTHITHITHVHACIHITHKHTSHVHVRTHRHLWTICHTHTITCAHVPHISGTNACRPHTNTRQKQEATPEHRGRPAVRSEGVTQGHYLSVQGTSCS